jgi:O-acetyl-ADP-ribose deacetylase (regulator of RNase III)
MRAQPVVVGRALLVPNRHTPDCFVFALVTKQRYSDKPTYDDLAAALRHLRTLMLERDLTQLALPRLGCGLDGLAWPRVRDLICEVFDDPAWDLCCYSRTA